MTRRTEITTPEILPQEKLSEISLRPRHLSGFIGQKKLKEALEISIQATLERGEPLDHILFHGPPGLGKTTLALLLAREMSVNIITTSGPVLEKAADLVGALTNLRRGDILFIDEIHRLRPVIEEFLYPAMEDYKVEVRLSEGPRAHTMTMGVEPFTLVGATTRFGLLTAPMRARFGITERLDFYPASDLARIIERSARIMKVTATERGAHELAERARGTPRVANRLLRRVRDFAQVRADGVLKVEVVREALQLLNVDEYGLDAMDTRILETIVDKFEGGPVGLNSLAVALGEDAGTIEEVYEPFLIQEGFIMRGPRGRVATGKAFARLGRSFPAKGPGGASGDPDDSHPSLFN
ncbi:MAG: Holliday junction branch migration DNA helicase RuvB [Gemmatimonadetes bacterium]|nr:Holliday junction branch migration DNA helicase RuvB [Gemmatimonadota bacterium]MDE2676473.1 Holliday junction branch migration DNA helicase RuvB [Gemmatimonadota bacterium]MXX33280.1 Holliday junction branch migration DNA helicase RuvB [Gemmatimonadota bacterium]MYD13101.1 Holliday junction branch migration DNA helicase RuvB [Gemmatimonadota bacterium]MYI67022.1 Holliday junction branch migration DNA helicase RuvB [Gemmatimonadota bacterium]